MYKLTIFAYRFFKQNKILFYSILLLTTGFFAFFSARVVFEEDISSLLPTAEKGGAEELVFSNLKVKDKIFVLFNPKSDETTSDDLSEISTEFIENLLAKDEQELIGNVLYQLDEDLLPNAISYLYANAPMFIDSVQYEQIDSLLISENIDKQMEANYDLLRSPAGAAYRSIIAKDPIALRNIFVSQMADLGGSFGGNYKLYNNHFFTADTTIAIAFISPNFKSFDSKQGVKLVELIENEIENFSEQYPNVEILYHGAPAQSVYNARRIKTDLFMTISVSLLIIISILLLCLKNKSTILYLILPVLYGVLFSLTLMYFIKGSMSLMALGIGAIVMGVAFSYCLHFIIHFKYVNDPEKVLKDQTVPVFLGALTTIGAFMGLLLTKSQLLEDFGLFASFGLIGTTLFCMFFLPQFFDSRTNRRSEKAFRTLEKINEFPIEKQRWLIASLLVVILVCYLMSSKVKFDSDLQNIGYHSPNIVKSKELLAQKTNNNFQTIYFAAVSEDFDDAIYASRELTNKLQSLKEAGKIESFAVPAAMFIPTDEQQKRINIWKRYWTPERIEKVRHDVVKFGAKHKFSEKVFGQFFRMLEDDYEPNSILDAEVLPEAISCNMVEYTDGRYLFLVPVKMDRSKYFMEVGEEVVKANRKFLVLDPMYYTNDMVKSVQKDFNLTLSISSIFVLIVLLISYKSIVLAVIAFLPMALSWYIVLGFMAIFGLEFNLINIVISTFIFGIGVDYSIFIMDGLLASYNTKRPLLTFHKTAIFFSALILLIVISSLFFAVHPAISSIGASTFIGMLSTILIAYTLEPLLFRLLISNRADKGKAPFAFSNIFKNRDSKEKRICDNYLYKGVAIERELRKELRISNNYELVSKYVVNQNTMLEYGCQYGFCSYWVHMVNENLQVVGLDKNKEMIAIANNCYQKTNSLLFTTDDSVLDDNYDVIVFNRKERFLTDDEIVKLLTHTKVVIIRGQIEKSFATIIEQKSLKKVEQNDLFSVFVKKDEE